MTYDDLIDSRVRELAGNWPTLDAAWGCMNCRGIFRTVVNARCPHCGSESVYDVVAALETERVEHVERTDRRRTGVGAAELLALVEALETVV